jgi:hypothetical protein
MILTETTPTTTIDASAPAIFTCSQCPFARLIEDNRYCCQVSQTASDVKRGHWEATVSCFEALAKAKAEAEKTLEPAAAETAAPIAQTDATHTTEKTSIAQATPAAIPAPTKPAAAPTTPTAIGRGRIEPISAKKRMPLIVPISRISSDISVSNFDRNELEILGELSLVLGGFLVPPVLVRHSGGYKVVSGHLQYHAAVLAKQLNPKAGENIPAIVLEEENQAAALSQLKRLKFAA